MGFQPYARKKELSVSTFLAAVKIEAFDLRKQPILFAEHLATEERQLSRTARTIEGGPIRLSLNVSVGMLGRWLLFPVNVVDHLNRGLHVVSHVKDLQGVNEVIETGKSGGKPSEHVLLQMSSLSGEIGGKDPRKSGILLGLTLGILPFGEML